MPWLRIVYGVSAAGAEALGDALEAAGAESVTFEAAEDHTPVFDPQTGEAPLWPDTRVIALFPEGTDAAQVLERVAGRHAGNLPLPELSVLEDQDWGRVWMDRFEPMRYGSRLWVCPSWRDPPDPSAVNLRLDPGMAFGTGTHATTAMCLEWLDALSALAGRVVVDYGCGSGILAIAALLLGAKVAYAVDNDPQALRVTMENARLNGVEDRVLPFAPEELRIDRCDVLVANILARPLIALAPRFAELLAPGGRLCLSGLLEGQAEDCLAAYQGSFNMSRPRQTAEWILLEGIRR